MSPTRADSPQEPEETEFDSQQDIARAGFADMLFDTDRNELYRQGLKAAIELTHKKGLQAHVLDIGTGTGLLSMMAVQCGADSVVACETFGPMGECAAKVIKLNGMQDKIKIIRKHSTRVKVGVDMERRANILVTEVFDTDLIGEGAIETFRHANAHLLEPDSFVVPNSATIYVQLVSGETFKNWIRLQPLPELGIQVPKDFDECAFSNSHDMQISALQPSIDFTALSKPVPVLKFDFTTSELALSRAEPVDVECIEDSECPAVFFWWDLNMDPEDKVILTCAPHWAGNPEWRDHWMQSVFYLPKSVDVKKGSKVCLTCCHDEFNFWFFTEDSSVKSRSGPPPCTCDLHRQVAPTRLGQVNSALRRRQQLAALKATAPPTQSPVVTLGDDSLLPLMAARLLGCQVFAEGRGRWAQRVAEVSGLTENVKWVDSAPAGAELVLAEPHLDAALLPWDNLKFWPRLRQLGCTRSVPRGATIWAMPVKFTHLWKIRAALDTCMGFKMLPYDELILMSIAECDEKVEPQPLWEYETFCLGSPKKLLELDFSNQDEVFENTDSGSIELQGVCHGFAVWMDWHLTEDISLTTGPEELPVVGEAVRWDKFTRQGVYFMDQYQEVNKDDFYRFTVSHTVESCQTDFDFGIFLQLV